MTTPHADLVAPGTWWLRGTRGANVYLVEADDGSLVLVDTGFRGSEAAILRALDGVAPGKPLEAILLTENGEVSERLLGIITLWDLPQIYEAVEG